MKATRIVPRPGHTFRTVTPEQYETTCRPHRRIAESLARFNREHPWNPFGNRRDLPQPNDHIEALADHQNDATWPGHWES